MALEYVGTDYVAEVGSVTVGTTVDLTSLTGGSDTEAKEGDLVIVSTSNGTSGVDSSVDVATSGYTNVADIYADDTVDTNLNVSYKLMGSTPDTEVVTDPAGTTSTALTVIVEVWRNVDQTTPIDVTTTTATLTNGVQITPASITPTTDGAIIFVSVAGTRSAASLTYSNTGFTETNSISQAIYLYSGIWTGYDDWTSGEYSPSAMVGSGSTTDSACAVTMAIRPAETINAVKSINGLSNVS